MKLRLGVLIKCKFNRIHGLEFHLDNVMFAAGRVNYHFFFKMKFTFTKQQPEFTFQLVEKSTSACGLSQGYQKEIIRPRYD